MIILEHTRTFPFVPDMLKEVPMLDVDCNRLLEYTSVFGIAARRLA